MKKKTIEDRLNQAEKELAELKEFHYRVKLGQRWFLCGVAAIGSVVAFVSYLLSGINNWLTFIHAK